jgi:acyl-coenzyme A synthetase/AMP-(fatty) acid ligase
VSIATAPTAIRALMKARMGEKEDLQFENPQVVESPSIRGGSGIIECGADAPLWTPGGRQAGDFSSAPAVTPSNRVQLHLFPSPSKILRENGSECDKEEGGSLVMARPWPGMLRGFWNDPDRKRFKDTYFSMFSGYYFTGDGAKKDADGYFWLQGRIDDVINVSGHRIGTAEVESALGPILRLRSGSDWGHEEGQDLCLVTVKTD